MKTRLTSLLLALVMLLAVAIPMAGAEELPYYEIDVFSQNANFAGIQSGWFGKLIKDKFNIALDVTATNLEGGASKFATMMNSGDLGDLLNFGSVASQDFIDARDLGLMFDMNQEGFLETNAPFIYNNMPKLIERAQLQYSGDGKAVWALVHDGTVQGLGYQSTSVNMPFIRYDLYKQLGSPEVTDMFAILPILKQMQDIYPVNEDGQPVYGVSYFPDWDGNFQVFAKWFALHNGYDNRGLILLHGTEDKTQEFLDPEGWYMKGVRWMYEANQLGLLDPDSITQTNAEYSAKLAAGRVLFSPSGAGGYNTPENTDAGRGMYALPYGGGAYYSWGVGESGSFRSFGIGAKAEDPARVMQFIDWLCSDEGAMEMRNGPKGLTWDLDENGKPYLTEFGIQCINDPTTPIPDEWGGGTFQDGKCVLEYPPRSASSIAASTGESISYSAWTSYQSLPVNQVYQQWRDDYGVNNPFELAVKLDALVASNNESYEGLANLPTMDLDMELMQTQVGDVIKQYSWKLAYAVDDAEYDKLYQEMVDKANSFGYKEVTEYHLKNAEKTMEARRLMTTK